MTLAQAFSTFSAKDAKTRFGELLDAALGQPVGITKHDRLTAYVVSKNFLESTLHRIEELEDSLWLAKAEIARKEGFVGAERVDAILSKFKEIDNNEVSNNKTSG